MKVTIGGITATRTTDVLTIREVMLDPGLWKTIAEDGMSPDNFEPDVYGDCWLEMQAEGEVIGLYHIKVRNSVTCEIHANILPKYRKQYSKATGRAVLVWIYEHAPECKKVVCEIPVIYPNVMRFARLHGFHHEGLNRSSYRKGGAIVDQWHMGITRDEIHEQHC